MLSDRDLEFSGLSADVVTLTQLKAHRRIQALDQKGRSFCQKV